MKQIILTISLRQIIFIKNIKINMGEYHVETEDE